MTACDKCKAQVETTGVPAILVGVYNISIMAQVDDDVHEIDDKDLCGKCTAEWMRSLLLSTEVGDGLEQVTSGRGACEDE